MNDKLIRGLEDLALNGHQPDLTIVLDMDPSEAFARVSKRGVEAALAQTGDRFEKEDIEWHGRLREAFLEIARKNPTRCVVVDAAQDEDKLEAEIWDIVTTRFPELLDRRDA